MKLMAIFLPYGALRSSASCEIHRGDPDVREMSIDRELQCVSIEWLRPLKDASTHTLVPLSRVMEMTFAKEQAQVIADQAKVQLPRAQEPTKGLKR